METGYFPLFINLNEKQILIAGAGRIASRRIKTLLEFGCLITVVAPKTTSYIKDCEENSRIVWINRKFLPNDVDNADFVLAVTDDESVNDSIVQLCREKHIWANHAGKKELSDFYFPGIAKKGNIVAGVTASGSDHKTAKKVTEAIRQLLKENI